MSQGCENINRCYPAARLPYRASALFRRCRFLIQLVLLLAAVPIQGPAQEHQSQVLIVSSQQTEPYLRFIGVIDDYGRSQARRRFATRVMSASALQALGNDEIERDYSAIITLGRQAATGLGKKNPRRPVVYALIPRDTYTSLASAGRLACAAGCTALYLDQPYARLIQVIRSAFSGIQRLAVLFGPTSITHRPEIESLLEKSRIQLIAAFVDRQDALLDGLDEVLKQGEVLLSIPDPLIFNSRTAQSILLKTYSYRVPLVATSRPYLKAGATLVVYSSPEQFARQAMQMLLPVLLSADGSLPVSQYPREYSIAINPHVADSFGLHLEHNPALQSMMEQSHDE